MPDISLYTKYVARNKLSKLVDNDHEMVKYFENIFKDITQTLPNYTASIEEIASAAAAQAVQVSALSDEVENIRSQLQNQTASAEDIIQLQSQLNGVLSDFQDKLDIVENSLANAQARAIQLDEFPVSGSVALVAGVATVNYPVTASTRIFLTSQDDGGTVGFLRISSRAVGTSFTISSSEPLDTSTVGYLIMK